LTAELNNTNAEFYLALYCYTPVGFLKLNIDAPLDSEYKNALELERIYLNEEATGKGIGSELVELTIKIAKENNKELIWLKAMDTSESSIALYKMGLYNYRHLYLASPVNERRTSGNGNYAKVIKR